MAHFDPLIPGVYRFRDLVNVYVIVRDGHGLAIEFGRGRVREHLDEMGVQQLDWILHTHHHRDLCLGDAAAAVDGVNIAVPVGEADLFAEVDKHWDRWDIYVNYDLTNRYDALRESVPVAKNLVPGEIFCWRGVDIEILATPGHTDQSISLLVEVDGQRLCFCGDAITGLGKIPTIHDLHWDYMPPGDGTAALIDSLEEILGKKPTMLLPARGEPLTDPSGAIEPLRLKLRQYVHHFKPNHAGRKRDDLHQVAEHIWFLGCTTYCILLENGHALIWDYGYVPQESIQKLKRDHGLKRIDAIAISHYHDDHVARIPELVYRLFRSPSPRPEVWVFENQAAIYTQPTRFNIPCLWPTPIPFDRVLTEDEVVDWHGVRLQFFHMPGQTEWHCGMVADIAGKRYAFTGDNLWKPAEAKRAPNGPVIWRNQQFLDGGTLKGFAKLRALAPDIILPAHSDPINPVTTQYFDALLNWAKQIKPMMERLIDQPDPEFGCDCFWVRFDPYRQVLEPDSQRFQTQVIIRNHHAHEASVGVALALPEGWYCHPNSAENTVAAKAEATFSFNIDAPSLIADRRYALAVEVVLDGVDYGEKAEMIIDAK